jgi:hypothetical protein
MNSKEQCDVTKVVFNASIITWCYCFLATCSLERIARNNSVLHEEKNEEKAMKYLGDKHVLSCYLNFLFCSIYLEMMQSSYAIK